MATVQIADIYNPLTFARLIQEAQTEKSLFIQSGVAVPNAVIANQIAQGGNIGELTGFNPLTLDEPNYGTDNPATLSTPAKISTAKQKFRLANANKSWSTMDLANELALEDAVGAITSRIGAYWANYGQKRLIQSCMGILADNIANDSSDMLVTVANDLVAPVTDAERISAKLVIDTKQTMGDAGENLNAIAMHSSVFSTLQKQELITYIQPSVTSIAIPMYLNKYAVIVDDGLPITVGTNRNTYTCILFSAGAFGYASGKVQNPTELERLPSSGNGSGQSIIYSRVSDLYQPIGLSFESGSVAGQSATWAELALATNWNRVWDRKNVNMAFLQVNN